MCECEAATRGQGKKASSNRWRIQGIQVEVTVMHLISFFFQIEHDQPFTYQLKYQTAKLIWNGQEGVWQESVESVRALMVGREAWAQKEWREGPGQP